MKPIKQIIFFDTETNTTGSKLLDIGAIDQNGAQFHANKIHEFEKFIQKTQYLCGHNIFNHDIKFIENKIDNFNEIKLIDTLYLSPLLFPEKPYHHLVKDDKLDPENYNNPLNDSIKAKELFFDEINQFTRLDYKLQQIYFILLHNEKYFTNFFDYIDFTNTNEDTESIINERFANEICLNGELSNFIKNNKVELAYSLALINTTTRGSISPRWVMKQYPGVENIIYNLRNRPCTGGCAYCQQHLDIHAALKTYFNFSNYRTFHGVDLQADAVRAAVNNQSLLAVFPTGGGKSLTFQVPALMAGENFKSLTVVISPLQSLMKDQVDNLEKDLITEAVTINGLLDPTERAKAFERVENGSASILYISPESLRSRSIERIILARNIARFVIDEAHCFSAWGQDFRTDYQYIGDFIKRIQEQKNLNRTIPVSCFTATAKIQVIEDIKGYFFKKLNLKLDLFIAPSKRENLHYQVITCADEQKKYDTLRQILENEQCPTIIYTSRTRRTLKIAEKLISDGFLATFYHGKLDSEIKKNHQDAFMSGKIPIIVATSAFGMGVDKKDVGLVIHYDISDSLENYVQEAGRAGRNENIQAKCYVLYNEEDLNKHFVLLNQTKMSIKEIQQIWRAIKSLTKFRASISSSALDIARQAGWDDNINDLETRVRTAIAALENAGFIKRRQNVPRIYASSIKSRNADEAITKINNSNRFNEKDKIAAIRIIKRLFSAKSHKTNENSEYRVDYLCDTLQLVKENVIHIIDMMREENILADEHDRCAYIFKNARQNYSLTLLKNYQKLESFMITELNEQQNIYNLKEINENAAKYGCKNITINKIKDIINIWSIKGWIKRKQSKTIDKSSGHISIEFKQTKDIIKQQIENRTLIAKFVLEYITKKHQQPIAETDTPKVQVNFSMMELKTAYEQSQKNTIFKKSVTYDILDDALFYLNRIKAMKFDGDFMVIYNAMRIERIEKDNKKNYNKENYKDLQLFYKNKIEQIHLVGEYAKKMISNYREALQFVDDYFQLEHQKFLNKYFDTKRQKEIQNNITPQKFKQMFGELSPDQLAIINDKNSQYIVVAAGPGSGKTKVLVHKLASLLLLEEIKHEQLLMLTFSRAAATEFKKRLIKLIGNVASYVEIKTFHSFCFDILGQVGDLEKSKNIIKQASEKIKTKDLELSKITKHVLVIDEAQDINAEEFDLINALIEYNVEMRVIAVGDDDQNIYDFRGANSEYMKKILEQNNSKLYELPMNYRSTSNLVTFTNQFVQKIENRMKKTPIIATRHDKSEIIITKFSKTKQLITPVVEAVSRIKPMGSTCVMANTNDEVAQIAALLTKHNIKAKCIQNDFDFKLDNLYEIRYFLNILNKNVKYYKIDDTIWEYAKRQLITKFNRSNKLEAVTKLIGDFEETNKKTKYISDFNLFINESKFDDFVTQGEGTVLVSTMHKSKGREFDNVFLNLQNYTADTDAKKRLLYVAMTRAKQNLYTFSDRDLFKGLWSETVIWSKNDNEYREPSEISINLEHSDVYLDYFANKQAEISNLISGDELTCSANGCLCPHGWPVLQFSKQFVERLATLQQQGYTPKSAKVNYMVFWQKEGSKREIMIVLPEIVLARIG